MSSIVAENGAQWRGDEWWDDDGVVVVCTELHQRFFGTRSSGRCWHFKKIEMNFPTCFLGRNQYQAFSSSCQNPILLSSHLDRCSSHKKRAG